MRSVLFLLTAAFAPKRTTRGMVFWWTCYYEIVCARIRFGTVPKQRRRSRRAMF